MATTFKRVVDLARPAGVSTQQVRNLEAVGVLPEVVRTAAGYRRYGPEHLGALLAYQALAAGHGPATARTVLREINQGELPAALSRVDASHAALHDQRRTLEQLHRTLDALAAAPPEDAPVPAAGMRVGELARQLGVRPSALRVWESAGLLTPRPRAGHHVPQVLAGGHPRRPDHPPAAARPLSVRPHPADAHRAARRR